MTYPAVEHYIFPRNQVEQARDELHFYSDAAEFRKNLVGLGRMYEKTAFVQSMQRYASYVAAMSIEESPRAPELQQMNFDFYSGALMAVHVNVAPLSERAKHAVLFFNPLAHIDELPNATEVEDNIRDWLVDWTGGENEEQTWHQFMSNQDEEYQQVAMQMAELLFEERANTDERELDFMSGFAFASNLIWQAYNHNNPSPPV